ncbi:class I SAM-dependent methyltransferase [Achromobacter xylosoxidans]|uniref:class I SAM-dependent methyltransferase n=1 Tax=Alcaligenes xylosoxydans xylosoxydans TaxID=85698 RepID=UPI0012A978E4|nr:class I SAM-dependent methyltransferase [Achromobacter xylosoxidans]CUR66564.1 Demethylrebeccamycin-D-glucose O-methyltransferase [Achromobacter xylosoxidans]
MTRAAKDGVTVDDVRAFWERHPLFTGESSFEPGTREFFDEHRRVYIEDCLAGNVDRRFIPPEGNRDHVLDLGCGPGFWVIELSKIGKLEGPISGADLTQAAVDLMKKRAEIYGVPVQASQQNAEALTFEDGIFSHVNCVGVIHHTPKTEQCVAEIARVLRPGGSALISVYYKNAILRNWGALSWVGKALAKLGAKLAGRSRDNIFRENNVDEIVRLYDGGDNPVGKAYTREEFIRMLSPHFAVRETFLTFFPARALPVPIPAWLHRWLDRRMGFLIHATMVKK